MDGRADRAVDARDGPRDLLDASVVVSDRYRVATYAEKPSMDTSFVRGARRRRRLASAPCPASPGWASPEGFENGETADTVGPQKGTLMLGRLLRALLIAALAAPLGTNLALARDPSPGVAESDRQLAQQLGAERIARNAATGKVSFIGANPDRAMRRPDGVGANESPERAARAFLARHGGAFGLRDDARDLRLMASKELEDGRSNVRFQQLHRGVPVLAAELRVNLDASRNILSANGEILPDLTLGATPKVTAAVASRTARQAIATAHGVSADALDATMPELTIYDPRLLGGPRDPSRSPGAQLVWRTEVTAGDLDPIRELVLIDAEAGGVALHFNQIHEAKVRYVCDKANVRSSSDACTSSYTRREGQGPTGRPDVDRAYDYSGTVYDWFRSRFDRDSLDGRGMALRSTVRYCDMSSPCPYPNAYWNGIQMVYGDDFANADDVVGHELAHGVTDHESSLLYYYQSGAINEALSDVFGEFIDLSRDHGTYDDDSAAARWLVGEDAPDVFGYDVYRGALRSMKDPTLFGNPDKMTSSWYVDYGPESDYFDNGGVHSNSGVANKAAYLMTDGGSFNGRTVYPIGMERAARIWYEVETNLLTSGSDYLDLYYALQQACHTLVGTSGITAANCGEVKKAADATEMNVLPAKYQAQSYDAPVCSTSTHAPRILFFDSFETARPSWAFSSGWARDPSYATTGIWSLFGAERETAGVIDATLTPGVTLPSNAYLHFRHAFTFEYGYDANWNFGNFDGGVLEYSADGGPWTDAGSLMLPMPTGMSYIGPIYNDGVAGGNPLEGRQAFANYSAGYSGTRIDLSGLAGKAVRFRWRLGTDDGNNGYGVGGWQMDDVRIYTCAPAPDLAVTALTDAPDPVAVGDHLVYRPTVRNNGPITASSVSLRFAVPTNATFLGASSGCSFSGGTAYGGRKIGGLVVCSLGTLASGASTSRVITVGPISSGKVTATATVVPPGGDWNTTNNVRRAETTAVYPAGQASRCTRLGTALSESLAGTTGIDVICGFGGNDTISGAAASDVLNGGPGVDKLYGGYGNDALIGAAGNDYLYGQNGYDRLYGGLGTDVCDVGADGGTKTGCP